MHLLATRPGAISDGSGAVDLGQTSAELVVLSAADSELVALAAAWDRFGAGAPNLRLANLLQLGHNYSVDRYVEQVIAGARLVIVRLLGGVRYWPYGVEQIAAAGRANGTLLAFLPGDDREDPDLFRLSSVPLDSVQRLWHYLVEGGPGNTLEFLRHAAWLLGREVAWRPPAPLPRVGLYWPGLRYPTLADLRAVWPAGAPVALLVFYRALLQAGQLATIDALIDALGRAGLAPLPVALTSLKEPEAAAVIATLIGRTSPDIILNATSFAVGRADGGPDGATPADPFRSADCPVLQIILSTGTETTWRAETNGLSARDLAMAVALPEVDGRVVTRAVSFKADARRHEPTQCWLVEPRPVADRVAFVADLAAAWVRLRRTPAAQRRVAIVLANYPNRDGRLANGVGLDTPASVVAAVRLLADADYRVEGAPPDGAALMQALGAGVTNDLAALDRRVVRERWPVSAYRDWFGRLPASVQTQVADRWGPPENDPLVLDGAFRLPVLRFGHVAVAIQPARGYQIDPARSYHDPALPPPHGYLAFYFWLRSELGFGAHAVIHFGKHGNLEWLPGKSVALSAGCLPEAALGPLPHLYPFIVNDPGEGTQAKRRAQAVILDHLTPPLTRADTYGPLRELETLVDEYAEASGLDPRRLPVLSRRILTLAVEAGLDRDCGIARDDDPDLALARLDRFLCELKELQIRDGLHVFGASPSGRLLDDLLMALVRLPRARGEGPDASLLRALAADLALPFDPLAAPATGVPGGTASEGGATRRALAELEDLAIDLITARRAPDPAWHRTGDVLRYVTTVLRPAVEACGRAEHESLLRGLAGRFVPPGPSGAPTRGRPEVLPTGRNFYSVDPRAVPTAAAWSLGWKSAALVVERHLQEHGEWPRAVALSAWGTANMRTGGDDLCQGLALLGVRPAWDGATGRVTGFEVMPVSVLGRPRVDVTLRVSGFFRDAFGFQIDLFDSAVRAVAALAESEADNPLAARVRREAAALAAAGVDAAEAQRRAGFRVFGSKPGAYGAGLQALIDERLWRDAGDLAAAYLSWGGYAYGAGAAGHAAHGLLETRLGQVEAVLHNQDNREHDLLDSDDYYQFEGGLAAAVTTLSGRAPAVYHNDHSRPETPRVRTLEEEIARVVRGRAVNPKWLAGVMRHGYKGAFEIAATVDYLFAFAATTGAVKDHHFDAVYDAYLADHQVRSFMADANPAALREMAARLKEALDRGLWRPRSNTAYGELAALADETGT